MSDKIDVMFATALTILMVICAVLLCVWITQVN